MTVGGSGGPRRSVGSVGVAILLAIVALAAVGCTGSGARAEASPVATTTVDMPKSYRFDPVALPTDPWTFDPGLLAASPVTNRS